MLGLTLYAASMAERQRRIEANERHDATSRRLAGRSGYFASRCPEWECPTCAERNWLFLLKCRRCGHQRGGEERVVLGTGYTADNNWDGREAVWRASNTARLMGEHLPVCMRYPLPAPARSRDPPTETDLPAATRRRLNPATDQQGHATVPDNRSNAQRAGAEHVSQRTATEHSGSGLSADRPARSNRRSA